MIYLIINATAPFIIFNIHFFELLLKFYQIYINIEIFFIISN